MKIQNPEVTKVIHTLAGMFLNSTHLNEFKQSLRSLLKHEPQLWIALYVPMHLDFPL